MKTCLRLIARRPPRPDLCPRRCTYLLSMCGTDGEKRHASLIFSRITGGGFLPDPQRIVFRGIDFDPC